ncbi:MAG: sulfite exporter TauE/SafE family protein [Planctomycetota bacterium]
MESMLWLVVPLAFCCEFIDSSLGMGYGTSLTPILMLMGLAPVEIVPAVLLSEFVTGLTAAFFHHNQENVNFHPKSKDTKVMLVLSSFAVIGAVAGACLAVNLSKNVLSLCIGIIVLSMGIIILVTRNRRVRFRWKGIIALGAVASFNKGMSGGGYGPLVMGGQMLSGVGVKNAIGITSLSESVTCLAGLACFFILGSAMNWPLALWLTLGAVLSAPLAALAVKRINEKKIKLAVALVTIFLGCLTLYKVLV